MEITERQRLRFDIRGQICPATLIVALREINKCCRELQAGLLELVFATDNRDATSTIPRTAQTMGYRTDVVRKEDYYEIAIHR